MSRIRNIPERDWHDNADEIAAVMTDCLRSPVGTMQLRPVQAVALAEAAEQQGLFGHIRVGAGKTLISALLPTVLSSARPMLLVPGSLVRDTRIALETLALHWSVNPAIQVCSYSRLGREEHCDLLEAFRPDLLIADEAQKLKRVRESAVARRVARYMHEHPGTRFCAMSGTLTKGSILDYWHLLAWALRSRAPVPSDPELAAQWADLLDFDAQGDDYSVLSEPLGEGCHDLKSARAAYRRRLSRSPGVIITTDQFTDTALTIRSVSLDQPPENQVFWDQLRADWIAPDGWYLEDKAFACYRVARQMKLGFCYVHDPRPPEDWAEARRGWCSFCRQVIQNSDRYDSEKQVISAIESGGIISPEYWKWIDIKDSFTPNTVAMWLSDHALAAAEEWGRGRTGGIVWTEQTAFARALAARTGWTYFGEEGLDDKGNSIVNHPGDAIVIASIQANGTGRNLQAFNQCLVTCPPPGGDTWEQLLGRPHRDGQKSDVEFTVWFGCDEDDRAIERAITQAEYSAETTGLDQKLQMATWQ